MQPNLMVQRNKVIILVSCHFAFHNDDQREETQNHFLWVTCGYGSMRAFGVGYCSTSFSEGIQSFGYLDLTGATNFFLKLTGAHHMLKGEIGYESEPGTEGKLMMPEVLPPWAYSLRSPAQTCLPWHTFP